MNRRNDSSNINAILHHEDPEDQPERGTDHRRTINGSTRDESSSLIPYSSSGSSSHCKTCSCSGPSSPCSSSAGPSSPRPSSPRPGPSSPRPGLSSPSSSSLRPSSPRSSSPRSSSPRPRPSSPRLPSSSSPSSLLSCGQAEGGEQVERQKEDGSSKCCSLKELERLPDCSKKLKPLSFSMTHCVLVDINAFTNGQLEAQQGRDVWRSNFVKMPCSQSSFINTKGVMSSGQAVRWETIHKQLTRLAKKSAVSVSDVKEAILKYNPKYKGQWSFDALAAFVECVPKTDNYFGALFPRIAALALELPNLVKKAIPMLQRGKTASITLSKAQISCLLANAFFCTFPHRNTDDPKAEYHNFPSINFNSLFGGSSEQKSQKLRAIMHYFKVMTDPVLENSTRGLVTFERHVLRENPDWRNCKEKMPKLHVTSRGSIEDEGTGMLQVDFACKRIGGGVLGSGLVQEEILFLMNPELIVSRLFTEKLEDNECLVIIGSQQFSHYTGYGNTFEWARPYEDLTERDEWERRYRQILAIDAQFYRHSREQYNKHKVRRELNKAYCGFSIHGPNKPDIATGKWGCGAFHGDPQLKAVIQLMAAAKAKRGLAFFTFNDETLKEELEQLHHLLVKERTTVAALFDLVETFCEVHQASGGSPQLDLFDFIRENLRTSSCASPDTRSQL
ncbi:poly(ADP-ribose) glycohydrolase [Halichoeres trimaculatus]|uniref:poly(ADP-ribose) glycohydrolase n=1 Tax=Halichoeres trimaculatus TaxID=147232 RepID=UPI003D9F573A